MFVHTSFKLSRNFFSFFNFTIFRWFSDLSKDSINPTTKKEEKENNKFHLHKQQGNDATKYENDEATIFNQRLQRIQLRMETKGRIEYKNVKLALNNAEKLGT